MISFSSYNNMLLIQLTKIKLLIVTIFLLGCTHLQTQPTHISWQERQIKLLHQNNWIIQGSLSVTWQQKRDIANFVWHQQQNNYTINISDPIGLNTVRIIGTTDKVYICQSGKKCLSAPTAKQLLLAQLSWDLPVSPLRYWILALPAPTKIDTAYFDNYGRLSMLVQQDWKIKYTDFHTAKNIEMPTLIELQNKEFLCKLKIRSWKFF